jgi:hypothetical protein
MKPRIFIIVALLWTTSLPGQASEEFRTAALAAIRGLAPNIAVENIRLLASPKAAAPLRGVKVLRSTFDPTLKRWQVQLECVPQTACLPTLGIIASDDRNLFPAGPASHANSLFEIRVGQRKQLLAETGAIRMRQTVVCLESGHRGGQVRVRELNGRKILLATVEPDGTLSIRRTP